MNETFACRRCGRELPMEQQVQFDGQELCAECLEEHTVLCRHCGERIWTSDNAGTDDHPLCQDCYDDHYTSCERCGVLLHQDAAVYQEEDDDERPYCPDCYHLLFRDKPIHDYYYKPEPQFYGTGPRFFGVELEMDQGGEDPDNAWALLCVANRAGALAYIKHDGSLDEGLELVTHPMSLDFQLQRMPWAELCRKAVSLGYRSHRPGTCGLHIHVSRRAFGETEARQDGVIARILYFFEKHWEELLKFSRRTQRQLDRWAARYGGRYTCINLQNPTTVEFRMFRGTLNCNTVLATLELVDRICDAALYLSDEELKSMAWTTFVSGIQSSQFPHLVQYLKERRLYVNELVEGGWSSDVLSLWPDGLPGYAHRPAAHPHPGAPGRRLRAPGHRRHRHHLQRRRQAPHP